MFVVFVCTLFVFVFCSVSLVCFALLQFALLCFVEFSFVVFDLFCIALVCLFMCLFACLLACLPVRVCVVFLLLGGCCTEGLSSAHHVNAPCTELRCCSRRGAAAARGCKTASQTQLTSLYSAASQ